MSWAPVAVFDVLGDPKGQPRPRAFASHGKARVYDPGTAEGWKALVALAAKPHLPAAPITGPVMIHLVFLFRRPQRLMTTKAPEDRIPFVAKPDTDNLAKAVMDSLTTIGLWCDDAQVTHLVVEKFYTRKGSVPGALVQVLAWEDDAA